MENLNIIIAKNLVKFRTQVGLTQLELAQKLNYSDKSISKWERGEGLPDISVLVKLSEIYGVKVDDFLTETQNHKPIPRLIEKSSKVLIALLSAGLVCLVASIIFAILFIIPSTKIIAPLTFIFALPVIAIVLTVFSAIWHKQLWCAIFSSLILWGIILSIIVSVKIYDIWVICVIGAVLEVLIIMWFIFVKLNILKKNSLKIFNNIFNKTKKNEFIKENEIINEN